MSDGEAGQQGGVLRHLSVGICVYDADFRLIFANPSYCASIDLPECSLRIGTTLADNVRLAAYRGAFGPGDPEAQVADWMSIDRSRPFRRRRRFGDGRVFEVCFDPLPEGGGVVSTIEISALAHDVQEERDRAQLLESALSLLRSGVMLFDADHRLILRNRRVEEMYGLSPDRLRNGMPFAEVVRLMASRGEFSHTDIDATVADILTYDRSRAREVRRVRPDGTVLLSTSDPIPGGGFLLAHTDITTLARAEDEAKRRAAVLDGILASMPHGICVYGPDRRVTMFNPAYVAIMDGAPVAIGDQLADVIRRRAEAGEYGAGAPADVERQQSAFDIAQPQARRRVRNNGTAIDIRTAPLPDGGHVSVVTDITPLVQAESEATRRAGVLDAMLSSIRHGVILFDRTRRIVAVNRVARELLGVDPGTLRPGRTQRELLAEMPHLAEFGLGEAAGTAARSTDSERRTAAGRILDVHTDPTPDGGLVVTLTDVTDERMQEAALREARDAAEAASHAKSRFLATMSHELRTPLNAVIGFSDALAGLAARHDPAQVTEFAQAINDAGRHLLSLINDILDVARIEAGRFELSQDRIELARVAAACLRIVGPQAQAAGVSVGADLPSDLPILQADERRLRQVLLNLLSNAIKFTPSGGKVVLTARLDDDGLCIAVQDTGIGIPQEQLERVFEPFTQLDASLARRFQGSGLGLYLSRALVAAHGGTLHLESGVGAGTTAVVRLPASRLVPLQPVA